MKATTQKKQPMSKLDIIERKYGKDVGTPYSPKMGAYLRKIGYGPLSKLLGDES